MVYRSRPTFKLFAERDLSDYVDDKVGQLHSRISSESDDYILNVNEEEYIAYLCGEYEVDSLTINFQDYETSPSKVEVLAKHLPMASLNDLPPDQMIEVSSYVYHLPFSGDFELLRCRPGQRLRWTEGVFCEGNYVCFEVLDFYGNAANVKGEAGAIMNKFCTQLKYLNGEVELFNARLTAHAKDWLKRRRDQIHAQTENLRILGGRSRTDSGSARTYSVPPPKLREKLVLKPKTPERAGEMDPTLDEVTYGRILNMVDEAGKALEKYPASHCDKDEEQLRDHILTVLEPSMDCSVTGESFNVSGKTDILVKHGAAIVFVAECKIWRGLAAFAKAIDQILKYLRWRDSKVAIVVFVRNTGLTSVLASIDESVQQHANYVSSGKKASDTWLNYRLHCLDDTEKIVQLAVLAFHLPAPR